MSGRSVKRPGEGARGRRPAGTVFRIEHRTVYRYPSSATESFAELRMWPRDTANQKIRGHELRVRPAIAVDEHTDFYGNRVESFSIPFRHTELVITAVCEATVTPKPVPLAVMEVPVAEAQQIYARSTADLFDFLAPTKLVPVGGIFVGFVRRHFRSSRSIGEALMELNESIHARFRYRTGSTDVTTSADEVARRRRGVCQDFAHFMLAVLRTARIPARYVSGYIETHQARDASERGLPELVGSAATHAWVEAMLPGGHWLGLDPTNNLRVSDRHIVIAVGRHYGDVTPLRGSYRGPSAQKPEVTVKVVRKVRGRSR